MKAREFFQQLIYRIINPLVKLLIRLNVKPDTVTTFGLILNIAAAIVFIYGGKYGERGHLKYVGCGCGLILFAGLFDMLDGQVARVGHMSSRFGALYDSVLDRYSELIMFFGICYYLDVHHYFLSSLFAFIALIGSMMVSYTRARAEAIGIECKGGLMQRPERIIIIGTSGLICGIVSGFDEGNFKLNIDWFPLETITIFTLPITIVAVLTNITAINRLIHCKKELK
ncbi:MAG: CDP-alcohol phosphatidyltransferase family protein [Bacteroidota bacterium]|nr:CDP-alcohol phosphatidyltransferase family protein [Bacteroidota bacterium]